MKKNPGFIISGILIVAAFFLGKIGCSSSPQRVDNDVEKVVEYDTIREIVSYPVDRPVPAPVIKKVQVLVTDQKQLDSLMELAAKQHEECDIEFTRITSELLLAQSQLAGGKSVTPPTVDIKSREYADSLTGDGWKTKWKANVTGVLLGMDVDVELVNTKTTVPEKKKLNVWATGGAVYFKDGTFDVPVGLELQRDKWGVGGSYLPVNQGGQLTIKRKFN